MKIARPRQAFKVMAATQWAQSALMTLQPGQSTGEPDNEHPHSEQWLLVLAGVGRAIVNKRRVALRRHALLLIERGEVHQITNSGKRPLKTLNFYAPPAYTPTGEIRKSAKRR
ncbi:MAG: cupin domain-containing protein [Planctomycetes bacterium]|nr:cupin domain-containing protein [Planctomycetota bacterium]